MILLLNGAFGIGKTTAARALAARIPGAIVYDPEIIGLALQRGARLLGRTVEDFQELPRWRRLTIAAIRVARFLSRDVIVPMAFSDPRVLAEIRTGISRFEPSVLHVCLVASEHEVHRRLRARGADPGRHAWQYRRASECCSAHASPAFERHLPVAGHTADELALELERMMREAAR